MDQQTLDALLDRLEPLAQKLGQGAEFLWEVSLRQTFIRGSVWLGVGLLVLGAALFVGIGVRRHFVRSGDAAKTKYSERRRDYERAIADRETAQKEQREAARKSGDYDRYRLGLMGLGLDYPSHPVDRSDEHYDDAFNALCAGVVLGVLSVIPLTLGLMRLLNPGWYAIRTVFEAVGL